MFVYILFWGAFNLHEIHLTDFSSDMRIFSFRFGNLSLVGFALWGVLN